MGNCPNLSLWSGELSKWVIVQWGIVQWGIVRVGNCPGFYSTEEIRKRINLATSAIARLKKIWSNNNIKTATRIRLYKSLVVSVLTYGCGNWTLKAESKRRIATFELTFFRSILNFFYRDHITNIIFYQKCKPSLKPQDHKNRIWPQ